LETFNADELLEKKGIYLDHRVQEKKRPETSNLNHTLICLIIHMKKLLDSDWLRVVQFKRNTSTKSVTTVQKV